LQAWRLRDTTAPVISEVASGSITKTTARISWKTNEAAERAAGVRPDHGVRSLTALEVGLRTTHGLTVSGLSDGTRYHYRVRSRDVAGNLAVFARLHVYGGR